MLPTDTINPLLQAGAHVIARRFAYTHHGLYMGEGKVLEYILDGGVTIVTLQAFADKHEIYIREHQHPKYVGKAAVERGLTRLGENNYNLFTCNCEHFVNWCIDGVENSRQVDNFILTIIPFYSLFHKSNFVRGCLKIIFDNPASLDAALERININNDNVTNPLTRAREMSEDVFGTQRQGVVNLTALITSATQLSKEYKSWLYYKRHSITSHLAALNRTLTHPAQALHSLGAHLGLTSHPMHGSSHNSASYPQVALGTHSQSSTENGTENSDESSLTTSLPSAYSPNAATHTPLAVTSLSAGNTYAEHAATTLPPHRCATAALAPGNSTTAPLTAPAPVSNTAAALTDSTTTAATTNTTAAANSEDTAGLNSTSAAVPASAYSASAASNLRQSTVSVPLAYTLYPATTNDTTATTAAAAAAAASVTHSSIYAALETASLSGTVPATAVSMEQSTALQSPALSPAATLTLHAEAMVTPPEVFWRTLAAHQEDGTGKRAWAGSTLAALTAAKVVREHDFAPKSDLPPLDPELGGKLEQQTMVTDPEFAEFEYPVPMVLPEPNEQELNTLTLPTPEQTALLPAPTASTQSTTALTHTQDTAAAWDMGQITESASLVEQAEAYMSHEQKKLTQLLPHVHIRLQCSAVSSTFNGEALNESAARNEYQRAAFAQSQEQIDNTVDPKDWHSSHSDEQALHSTKEHYEQSSLSNAYKMATPPQNAPQHAGEAQLSDMGYALSDLALEVATQVRHELQRQQRSLRHQRR